MSMNLSFFGAARTVTGSRYLLEANGLRILIDCGLYQERDYRYRNWDPFHVDPDSIDAVVLTHGHLDHVGLLPRLVAKGFSGPIYCSSATAQIGTIIMADSAKLMSEDVRNKRKRHASEGRESKYPYEPLYDRDAVEKTITLFRKAEIGAPVDMGHGIDLSFAEAGHILGSTHVVFGVTEGETRRTVLFSGDIGRWNTPILRDPTPFPAADYVVVESTYGNRTHDDNSHINGQLAGIISETSARGGNIIIPSFAVERTQEVLYRLNELKKEKRIPHMMAFVDSPMAIRVTDVFKAHANLYDDEARGLLESGDDPCDFPGLQMCRSVAQSKAINQIRGSAIIIAGSGMCTGGRVKHHLSRDIGREETTVLFVGYQAKGTLGREILEGAEEVRINGKTKKVRARIERINGFSGHADRTELLRWMSGFETPPQRVFVTHGEEDAALAFGDALRDELGLNAEVPNYEETVTLD